MAEVAFELINALVGLGNIGAGIGFDVAEHDKMKELKTKSQKLKEDSTTASNLYAQYYYVVTVHLDRVKKDLDKLPTDIIELIDEPITSDLDDSNTEEAISTLANILSYGKQTVEVISNLVKVVVYLREQKAKNPDTEPAIELMEYPFKDVPLDGAEPPAVKPAESSFPKIPKIEDLMTGLNIAGLVFGIGGLATTIGLGTWTIDKLDKAISDVEKKQTQVTEFQKSLTKVLDAMLEFAGPKVKDYDDLLALAGTWKKTAEDLESYEKALYYAIQGYYMKKSLEEVKALVNSKSDEGKTFPEGCYPFAKTMAEDINTQLQQNKTDKEIITYFAKEHPNESMRFVLSEYFISTLRSI